MAIRFRSSTDEATRSAVAQLQETVAAQQVLIQEQSEQIAALRSASERQKAHKQKDHIRDLTDQLQRQDAQLQAQGEQIAALRATSESQQAYIRALTDQLQRQAAQLRAQLQRSAEIQQQLYGYIQRVVGTVVQHQSDLLAQLSESLPDLSEQQADTEPIQAIHEEFKPSPAAQPAPPARAAELDVVYAPVAIAADDAPEPGSPIPPRKPPDEQLKVMRAFIDAGDRFVDYIGEGLNKGLVNRLEDQNKIERHKFHPYKLRPTPSGREWFEQASQPDDSPPPDDADTQPLAVPVDEDSAPMRDIQNGQEAFDPLADEDDFPPLEALIGAPDSDSAKLTTLLMERSWAATESELQAAFPRSKFVNVIIDAINERAQDEIGDNLITEEDGNWTIDVEYRPMLLKWQAELAEAPEQADDPAGAKAVEEAV